MSEQDQINMKKKKKIFSDQGKPLTIPSRIHRHGSSSRSEPVLNSRRRPSSDSLPAEAPRKSVPAPAEGKNWVVGDKLHVYALS